MVKISIITTTFNAVGTIRDCLESVKGQSYVNVEHIVVDGASTDGTLEILEEFQGQVTGKHPSRGYKLYAVETPSTCPRNSCRVVSEPDCGIYDGMNKGLRLASGDVVGILNGDDFYAGSDVLSKVARMFEDDRVDACYGDLVYIAEGNESLQSAVGSKQFESFGAAPQGGNDSWQSSLGVSTAFRLPGSRQRRKLAVEEFRGHVTSTCPQNLKDFKVVRYWKSGEFDARKFYWGWMPPHPTFFVRRSVYEEYGLFNLELGTAADYELMLRFLVRHKISCAYLPEIIVKMRSGGASNVTLKSRLLANKKDRKAWKVNGLRPYPWTILMKPLRKVGQWFSKPPVLKLKIKS